MAKISGFRRLVKEDFDKDDQPLIEKLASVFNLFQEQVYYAFNNGIDISNNLNAQTTTIKITVDSSGVPQSNKEIKYTLKTRPLGSTVIKVRNLTDTTLLTGAPFMVFSLSGDILTINQITGLLVGKEYEITVVVYG